MMKTQMFLFLSALCMLTITPLVRIEAQSATSHRPTPNILTTNITKSTVQTVTEMTSTKLTTNTTLITTLPTTKSKVLVFASSTQKAITTTVSSQPNLSIGLRVLIFFIVVLLLLMAFFAYKWYSRHPEQRSINELRRNIAQSIRTARAAAILERLRPSRKQKVDENEMESGMIHDDGHGRLETGKDDKEDDSSADYTRMEGTNMMEQVKMKEMSMDDSSTSSEEEDDEIKPEPEDEKAKEDTNITVL